MKTQTGDTNSNRRDLEERTIITRTENPTFVSDIPGKSALRATRRSALRYGSGRNSTASTMLNIVVFTPIPTAMVSAATNVERGDFRRPRAPPRRSWRIEVIAIFLPCVRYMSATHPLVQATVQAIVPAPVFDTMVDTMVDHSTIVDQNRSFNYAVICRSH